MSGHRIIETTDQSRRSLLGGMVAFAGAASLIPTGTAPASTPAPNRGDANVATAQDSEIRPFTVTFPDESLDDLHRRLANTRWPDREQVADESQGVRLDTMQNLAQYWR